MLHSVDTIMSLPGFSNALPEVGHGAPGYSNPREVRVVEVVTEPPVVLGWGDGLVTALDFHMLLPSNPARNLACLSLSLLVL